MRDWSARSTSVTRVGVLLYPQFSNHCLANAVEPLRAANALSGRRLYAWDFLTVDGASVQSSSGLPVAPAGTLAGARGDVLMLMPSYGARRLATVSGSRALRAAAGRFAVLAGLDMGAWLLAAAGLLDGCRATVHWDEFDDFAEAFPEVHAERRRTIRDGSRWSCGGAMTAFDLVMDMIAESHGQGLRIEVAGLLMASDAGAAPDRLRPGSTLAAAAVAAMRAHVEDRVGLSEIAGSVGLGLRQMEALFARELGATPRAVYRTVRLSAARRLVEQTGLSVAEIALRCGYDDPSAMTRAFRGEFGITPRALRAAP